MPSNVNVAFNRPLLPLMNPNRDEALFAAGAEGEEAGLPLRLPPSACSETSVAGSGVMLLRAPRERTRQARERLVAQGRPD